MPRDHEFILTLSCRDATGIVYAVSGLLYQGGCNIIDSQQFGDLQGEDATGLFFMRVPFAAPPHLANTAALGTLFAHTQAQFGMQLQLHGGTARLLLLVSQHGHCLNDLLFRWRSASSTWTSPASSPTTPTSRRWRELRAALPPPAAAPQQRAASAQEREIER